MLFHETSLKINKPLLSTFIILDPHERMAADIFEEVGVKGVNEPRQGRASDR